jgi:hypothetical protein
MGALRRRDVGERFDIEREAARRELLVLARLGLLRPAGRGRAVHYLAGPTEGA